MDDMNDLNPAEQMDEQAIDAFDKASDEIEKANNVESAPEHKETAQDAEVSEETNEAVSLEEESAEAESGDAEASADESATEISIDDIDPEVLEYCRTYFGSDEKVIQLAKISPEIFDDIRAVLDEELNEQQVVKEQPKQQQQQQQEQKQVDDIDGLISKLDPDVHGVELVGAIKALADRQREGQKVLTQEQQKLEQERSAAFDMKIDTCLDKYSKSMPQIGSSNQLSRGQKLFRQEIFAHANVTATLKKIPIERAIELEVNKYKNMGGEKVAAQKIIDKLNTQEKRTINKPTRRLSQQGERKFSDQYEEAEYNMAKAEQEAGLA